MRCFADTSFLCSLYREQDNSQLADAFMGRFNGEIIVSSQVLWEFRQSARFQVFRHQNDKRKGFSKSEAERMIDMLAVNVKTGGLMLARLSQLENGSGYFHDFPGWEALILRDRGSP
jgi:predicted nucleic acid-binding protein